MKRVWKPFVNEIARNAAGRSGRCREENVSQVLLPRESSSPLWCSVADGGSRRALSSAAAAAEEKIVSSVVLERLPVVLPPLNAEVARFRQFSFEWRQQHRRHYPQEFLEASANRGETDESAAFEPGPGTTEADKSGDVRSLQRALNQRLYLVLYGVPSGSTDRKPVWHFPSKLYSKEPSLRQCAEAALGALVGDVSKSAYFVGNAPCGHLPSAAPPLTRFFFKSQLLVSELPLEAKCLDFAWISKEEVPLFFTKDEAEFLKDLLQ